MNIRGATSRGGWRGDGGFYFGPFASRRAADAFAEGFPRSFQNPPLPDQNPARSGISRLHLFGDENVPRAVLRGLHEAGVRRWKSRPCAGNTRHHRRRADRRNSNVSAKRPAKRSISSAPPRCTSAWKKFPAALRGVAGDRAANRRPRRGDPAARRRGKNGHGVSPARRSSRRAALPEFRRAFEPAALGRGDPARAARADSRRAARDHSAPDRRRFSIAGWPMAHGPGRFPRAIRPARGACRSWPSIWRS